MRSEKFDDDDNDDDDDDNDDDGDDDDNNNNNNNNNNNIIIIIIIIQLYCNVLCVMLIRVFFESKYATTCVSVLFCRNGPFLCR